MDQARAILRAIWEQRFWVLSSVGVLVVLICWYKATGELDSQFSSRKRAIDGMFSAMNTLNTQRLLPNENVIEGNSKETSKEGASTLEKWQELYDFQSEKVLFWPQDHLDAQFIKEIDQLRFGDPFPASKAPDMRANYWNYIEKRFDGLLEIVQALKLAESGRSSSRGGRGGGEFGGEFGGDFGGGMRGRATAALETEEDDYLVQWIDQGELQAQLHFEEKPTAIEIWVAQEDLWVYETLLNVIAKTNKAKGATRPDNTAVRMIAALQVGRNAVEGGNRRGNLVAPLSLGGASSEFGGRGGEFEGGGMEFGGGYGRGGNEGGGEFGGGQFGGGEFGGGQFGGGQFGEGQFGEGASSSDAKLLSFRYLDTATGEPLAGDRESLNTEFRKLPVRMVLRMDQSWIPHVLVECANAALPVEVKKLRINPDQSGEGFGKGGASGGRSRSNIRGMQPIADDGSLVEVEIQGAVYIYNEPDKSKLEIPGEEDGQDQFADTSS